MSLKIADNLSLPTEAVTQTFAILAKRGVGKTYTASVMVEEMLKANLHVVVVDPIGVWFGLRSSADGKSPGFPIIIAGGERADVPIESSSGEILAEMIVEQHLSMVIDISLFRKHEQHTFMTAFAETLYRKNRQAVHLVLDEADEFAPQRTMGDEARMLGAIEDLVRRGRARGIAVTMITQRPAVLNKNVLTQIEVLVALRLTSPQDRAAIAEWVKYHQELEYPKIELREVIPDTVRTCIDMMLRDYEMMGEHMKMLEKHVRPVQKIKPLTEAPVNAIPPKGHFKEIQKKVKEGTISDRAASFAAAIDYGYNASGKHRQQFSPPRSRRILIHCRMMT